MASLIVSSKPDLENYIKEWYNNDFPAVLDKISNEDLEHIAPQLDLSLGFNWWNEDHSVYCCVSNQIRSNSQWKILLKADKEGALEVSDSFNKKLYTAMVNDDREMIRIIMNHKRFSYPGTGSYNSRFFNAIELAPLCKLIGMKNFNETHVDTIKFVYDLLDDQNNNVYIADFFYAVRCNGRYCWIRKGLEMFAQNQQ